MLPPRASPQAELGATNAIALMFMNLVHAFLVAYWLAMDFNFGHPHHGTWVKKVERLRRALPE